MKFKKPNQHGAWAMIIMPVLFGIFLSKFNFYQLLFFASWFMIFFFIDNVLFYMKQRKKQIGYLKGASLFLGIATLLLLPLLIYEVRILLFFIAMIPFACVNIYFASKRNERNILNDFSAIIIFSIAGLIAYFLGNHTVDIHMLYVFGFSFMYFVGTTFYVKSMIREKKNIKFKYYSFGYHALLVVLGFIIHPLVGIAIAPSLVRAVYLYGKNVKPMKIGILEIANACFITLFIGIYFYSILK